MAKISLRVYTREIEGMVEGGLIEEAVAHCQNILKVFPMHVETYRLLGKSFLESRRYADAADIFARALAAVPDDFVAHVGMSIIRDDEGKLDDAIWHMERAFEVQPSNPAIQGELRRLYGRRDGVEPPKIRLSRDALANMYAQGELFNQAIAEIRAVLAEDPSRPDLQVMLARAYYRGGQKVEAAEMAANLLKKYPYCLDALRILVDVLPGTGRAENMQVYRQRLQLLDPYTAFAKGSVFGVDQVPDNAINLERLEYRTGAGSASSQPNWASSLGIKLGDEKPAKEQPAWLQSSQEAEPTMSSPAETPDPQSGSKQGDESIPDWMRSAGWQEGAGGPETPPADSEAAAPAESAEPLAQGDIPDWLKSMAPAGAIEESGPAPATEAPALDGSAPDWLSGLSGAMSAPAASAPPEQAPAAPAGDEDVPDWLNSLSGSAIPPQQPAAAPAADENVPDWLSGLSGGASEPSAAAALEQPPAAPAADENVPDWLSGLTGGAAAVEPAPVEQTTIDQAPAQESTIQETKPRAAAAPLGEDEPFVPTGEAKPLDIGDDALAWLEGLAAKQGAKSEELLTKPEDRSEETPDWLQQSGGPASTAAADEPAAAPAGSIDPLRAQLGGLTVETPSTVEPVPGSEDGDDTLSWLKGLADEDGQTPAASQPVEEEASTVPPDLFEKVFENHRPVPPPDSGPLPSLEPEAPAEQEEDVTVTGWLKGLATAAPEAADSPAAMPAASSDEGLPAWLKDLNQPVPGAESASETAAPEPADSMPLPGSPSEEAAPAEPATDLPEWLRGTLDPSAQAAPVQPPAGPASQDDERPAWLDEGAPVNEAAAPTAPEEWVPVEKAPSVPEPAAQASAPQKNTAPPVQKPAPVQPPAPESAGMLAHVPAEDKDAELLGLAQAALGGNKLNEAMQYYGKLIKKGRLLDESIHDLREAIYRFPVDVIVWQTLGDAYMKAGRLQDALDAYTKAEELLR